MVSFVLLVAKLLHSTVGLEGGNYADALHVLYFDVGLWSKPVPHFKHSLCIFNRQPQHKDNYKRIALVVNQNQVTLCQRPSPAHDGD